MEPQISNEDLLTKLKESHLEARHKEAVEPMIPKMNDDNRQELMGLIDESHKVAKKVDQMKTEHQEKMRELNKEYDQKMKDVVKEESENARKQFEELENKEEEKGLEELEGEISQM
jgi:hypothetical protein